MPTLLHLPLSPFCRKVRIVLRERSIEFTLQVENVQERRPEFLELNPAGTVPVLIDNVQGLVVVDSNAIVEYLDEVYPGPSLIGRSPAERAETRRLVAWFDHKFAAEVTQMLYGERVMRRLLRRGAPNAAAMHAGKSNIHYHLDYIGYLAERRNWLAGDEFSLADVCAGAHLSTLDYLGDVPWDRHEAAKHWYQRIKSRPSFRPLLADHVPGFRPPAHYADLDF